MNYDSLKPRVVRLRPRGNVPARVQELAEAGASGISLTQAQTKEICEALHSHIRSVRNQFHSGH